MWAMWETTTCFFLSRHTPFVVPSYKPPTATAGKSGHTQEKRAVCHTSVLSQESFERILGNLLLSVETWRKFHECDRAVV